jgi:hypothetical protein
MNRETAALVVIGVERRVFKRESYVGSVSIHSCIFRNYNVIIYIHTEIYSVYVKFAKGCICLRISTITGLLWIR